MSLNFSVAVWPGLALFTFGLVKDRLLPSPRIGRHFCGGLKYFKSGGGWSFLVGIRLPSALMK